MRLFCLAFLLSGVFLCAADAEVRADCTVVLRRIETTTGVDWEPEGDACGEPISGVVECHPLRHPPSVKKYFSLSNHKLETRPGRCYEETDGKRKLIDLIDQLPQKRADREDFRYVYEEANLEGGPHAFNDFSAAGFAQYERDSLPLLFWSIFDVSGWFGIAPTLFEDTGSPTVYLREFSEEAHSDN